MDQPLFSVRGVQDLLEVYQNKITLTPKGVLGFMSKGLKGTKTFPLNQITAIQLRKAGPFLNGYLQLTVGGSTESRKGLFAATSDENSFVFRARENEVMLQVAAHVENWTSKGAASPPPLPIPSQGESLVQELEALAKLKSAGVLTEEEFTAAKRRLIGV